MIPGINEIVGLFDILRELDLVDHSLDGPRAANYVIWLNGHNLRMSESDGGEEFIDDLTEEELRVMSFYTEGYDRWYGEQLSKIVEDAVFGDNDEGK